MLSIDCSVTDLDELRQPQARVSTADLIQRQPVSGAIPMNASEKAISLGFVSKIATIVNLFQSKFDDATPDLTPWLDDPMTRATIDPDSIDLGFHFPRRNSTKSQYTMLLQIRLQPERGNNDYLTEIPQDRVVGLELSSYSLCGCLWEFSTVGDWQFCGSTGLSQEYQAQIKSFCQDVLAVFNSAEYSRYHPRS